MLVYVDDYSISYFYTPATISIEGPWQPWLFFLAFKFIELLTLCIYVNRFILQTYSIVQGCLDPNKLALPAPPVQNSPNLMVSLLLILLSIGLLWMPSNTAPSPVQTFPLLSTNYVSTSSLPRPRIGQLPSGFCAI